MGGGVLSAWSLDIAVLSSRPFPHICPGFLNIRGPVAHKKKQRKNGHGGSQGRSCVC